MSMTVFWNALCRQWHDLSKEFWSPTPQELTRAEIERLDVDLARRYRRLIEIRKRADLLAERLESHRRQLATADERMPCANAERLAQVIERLEARLTKCESVYAAKCEQFARRKQLLQALRSGRAIVIDVIPGQAVDEDS